MGKSVDFVDGGLERRGDIRVRWFIESDMAIADLDEIQFAPAAARHFLSECPRTKNAAANGPDDAGAGPCHAFQESAPVDAVVILIVNVVIVNDVSRQSCRLSGFLLKLSTCKTATLRYLFLGRNDMVLTAGAHHVLGVLPALSTNNYVK